MPESERDLPSTLERSPKKAQRTYEKTVESAEDTYDSPGRAHRAAWAAVKHSFKKVGNRWVPKDEKGPSDPQAKKGGREALKGGGKTYGGVDVEGSTRDELYQRAKELDVKGASKMRKEELAEAIAKKGG